MSATKNTININTDDFDREKALESALNQIQKQFGKGAIMKLGDTPT